MGKIDWGKVQTQKKALYEKFEEIIKRFEGDKQLYLEGKDKEYPGCLEAMNALLSLCKDAMAQVEKNLEDDIKNRYLCASTDTVRNYGRLVSLISLIDEIGNDMALEDYSKLVNIKSQMDNKTFDHFFQDAKKNI